MSNGEVATTTTTTTTTTMEIFLTDFSIRPDSCPIQGPFCPPELEHGANYTPSSDVYSMGILASFMIPDMKAAMKAESAISTHWQLLLDCQSSQPNQRPKASAVVEAVVAIEGFLTRN
jgi:serine/threonine protein kinase